MVFVDLTKAFDTVRRDGHWEIMAEFECLPKFIAMVCQFYNDMHARFRIRASPVRQMGSNSAAFINLWNLTKHQGSWVFWHWHALLVAETLEKNWPRQTSKKSSTHMNKSRCPFPLLRPALFFVMG